MVVVYSGLCETFADTLVCVLQIVFSDQSYAYLFCGVVAPFEEVAPRTECRHIAYFHLQFAHYGCVESLFLHVHGYFIYRRQVFALYHAVHVDVAERSHFFQYVVIEMFFCTQYQHVRLYSHALQFLYGVLCRFGLQFAGCFQIGYVCKMNAHGVASHFPFHLTYGLKVRHAFDVTDGSADFGYDEVVVILLAEHLHVAFYFICNVWYHLYCLAQIIAAALLVYYSFVDASRGERVGLGGLYAGEALVMTEVEVGLHAVHRNVAFTVLVWVECSRVDVDVRVKLLNGDVISPCLKQLSY